MTVAATGHRPDKLYGYDIHDIRYLLLMAKIQQYLRQVGCTRGISGMALGMDIIFAEAVLNLKKEGIPIKLTCAIPCKNHKAKWGKSRWVDLYDQITQQADEVVVVSDCFYNQFVMQERNKWMVDRCDILLALYNGTEGGTKNCIDYAVGKKKEIVVMNPQTLEIGTY